MKSFILLSLLCFAFHFGLGQSMVLMKIEGVNQGTFPGDGVPMYMDYIQISGISFDYSNNITHAREGGYTPPRFTLNSLTFLHGLSKSSIFINNSLFNFETIDVEILFIGPDPRSGEQIPLYKIELHDARINSVTTGTDAECTSCRIGMESVSLLYKQIVMTYIDGGVTTGTSIP